jgi:RNA-binding protein NOB1
MSAAKVTHLVLDSGAFIKGHDLQTYAEKFYSIREVIDEIRDKVTKQRIQSLPFEITFMDPPALDLRHAADFSKKTGDYGTLSVVDLKLLALTSYLQRLHVNEDHLKREPGRGTVVASGKDTGRVIRFQPEQPDPGAVHEGEWITAENMAEVTEKLTSLNVSADSTPAVACMTADYAMQNVLLQSGLGLMSVTDSRVISRTNHFILRCFACRATTCDMRKKFCPGCGNANTLKRVAVTVNENGEKELHINFRKPISTRGTNKSLPMPKGGKHANNPIVVEDQPVPQQKPCRKALLEKRVTGAAVIDSPDYVLRSNPFAVRDVTSRAARHSYMPGKK